MFVFAAVGLGMAVGKVAAPLKKIIWKEYAILKSLLWLFIKENIIEEKGKIQLNQGEKMKVQGKTIFNVKVN